MTYDVAVIGAGVIGCAIARELSAYNASVALIEKREDICCETSKANSAIVHAGFDAKNGTLMAKMNVRGNEMMDKIAKDLDVDFKRVGAFVLCFDENDKDKLEALYQRGVNNGVKGLSVLTREEAIQIEPNLSDDVVAALYAKTSGIICPFELTAGFAENAAQNGVEFFFNSGVKIILKQNDIYEIITESETFYAKSIVNCAGVYADFIHNMICSDKLEIIPRRGEYILCDKTAGNAASLTLFQLPTIYGKGILVSPTVHGNLLLGPTAEDIDDKEDISTTADGLSTIIKKAALSVKNLPSRQAITSFTGLRAHTKEDEFILRESAPLFFDAAGIESPGLSSAPAIGEYMAQMVASSLSLTKKENFNPIRKAVIKADSLPFDERAKLIKEEPSYGKIICRCEMISEGEIVSAINRVPGATTLDGVKRRVRAGSGRCQGGFCSPKVISILARELNQSPEEVRKNSDLSYLIAHKTQKGGNN